MALTEIEIRAAKAVDKPVKLFDGGGLFLLVNPNGSRCSGSNTATRARNAASRWACIQTFR
jgi:hypothetical protein